MTEIEQEIAEVKQAMVKIQMGGQMVRTRNGQVQMASYAELRARLNQLEMQKALDAHSHSDGCFGTPMVYIGR